MITVAPITYSTDPIWGERFHLAVLLTAEDGASHLLLRDSPPDAHCIGTELHAKYVAAKLAELREVPPEAIDEWLEQQGVGVRVGPEWRLNVNSMDKAVRLVKTMLPAAPGRRRDQARTRRPDRVAEATSWLSVGSRAAWGRHVRNRFRPRDVWPRLAELALPQVSQYVDGTHALLLLEPVYVTSRDPVGDAVNARNTLALYARNEEAFRGREVKLTGYVFGADERLRNHCRSILSSARVQTIDASTPYGESELRRAVLSAGPPDIGMASK